MNGTVFLEHVRDYDQDIVDRAVEAIVVSSGLAEKLRPGLRVVLKLNLLMKAAPEEAVTSHPAVVRGILRALHKRGVDDITLADCPSGPFSASRLKGIYEGCGIAALADEGAKLNYDMTCTMRSGSGATKDYDLLKVAADADLLIGVAKLKTHAMAGMTGAVKNWFGMIPGLEKAQMHCRFPRREAFGDMLCDLYDIVSPDFNFVDGILGMEGDGPSGGRPRAFGILAGGADGYALDRVLCECIGLPAKNALSVAASIARGQAPADVCAIAVAGDRGLLEHPVTDLLLPRTADVGLTGNLPRLLQPLARRFVEHFAPHPVVRTADCVGCRRCYEICPQHTIEMRARHAYIRRDNCIRCFCCHEVCPQRAIDIKSSRLLRLLR